MTPEERDDPAEALTRSPRTEAVIDATMKRFPGETKAAQARYFEAVHQELAPLARELEVEINALREELASFRCAGVWDGNGHKFRTYRNESLNGLAMHIKDERS